jgi:uncharacterized delta-60 repeat protein
VEALEDRCCPSGGTLQWSDPLDPTFGDGGTVRNNFGSGFQSITDVKVLSDGKLLTAGYVNGYSQYSDFNAARYNADGTLDTSFGSGGLAAVDFKGGDDQAWAAAVQPGSGGKIVLAGSAYVSGISRFGAVRLNLNGTLDATFGGKTGGGKVTASPSNRYDSYAYSMAMLPDGSGKFVLAGLTMNLGSNASGSISLARFNADGTLDTTFGNKGTTLSTISASYFGGSTVHEINVAVDASGRIVVAGTTANTPKKDFMVARFNPNGSLDTAFGAAGTGVVTTDISGTGGQDDAYSLALQGDGKILVGGLSEPPNAVSFATALVRYTPDGRLDTTFDGDGIATAYSVPGYVPQSEADALVVQPDGKIVAAGRGGYATTRPDGTLNDETVIVVAMRFNPDGSLDTSYGPSGAGVMTSLGYNAEVSAMALQPDGRTVVAGKMNTATLQYFALTRFTASSAAPSPVQVGSFTASSTTVAAGNLITLTAGAITTTNAAATITQVAFYSVDSFGAEQLIGYGTANADGTWTLTFTVNLASGSYTLLAMAVDSTGAVSDPFTLSLNVL